MGRALSEDLRERAVQAFEEGDGTKVEIAAAFKIGTASLMRWTRRWRERGDYGNDNHLTGRPAKHTTPENLAILKKMLDETPDMTLDELTAAWSATLGTAIGHSTTSRAVAKLGYTLKKRPSGPLSATKRALLNSAQSSTSGNSRPTQND